MILGRAMLHFGTQEEFDKVKMEKEILEWMPYKVRKAFNLYCNYKIVRNR